MARLRVWRDSPAVVIGRTACALAVLMSFGQPMGMKAQLFSKAEAPSCATADSGTAAARSQL